MTKEKTIYSRGVVYAQHQEIIERAKESLKSAGYNVLYVQLKQSNIIDISKITKKILGEFTSKIYYKIKK
jgi:predicted transcriptional regulator